MYAKDIEKGARVRLGGETRTVLRTDHNFYLARLLVSRDTWWSFPPFDEFTQDTDAKGAVLVAP